MSPNQAVPTRLVTNRKRHPCLCIVLVLADAPRKIKTAHNISSDSIKICGKTGTAQNPHGKDHSIFIAFAPKENPQIAIAVYVENGGWGSTWAAPIAGLMINKYTENPIKKELLCLNKNLLFIQRRVSFINSI